MPRSICTQAGWATFSAALFIVMITDAPQVCATPRSLPSAQKPHPRQTFDYTIEARGAGFVGDNQAQGLLSTYTSDGLAVTPRHLEQESWRWIWHSTAWGRPGMLRQLEDVPPRAEGCRTEYTHPGLVEWYVNRPQGLEQGYAVAAPPPGRGPLWIVGEVTLEARLTATGTLEFLGPQGRPVLQYGAVHVFDATGAEIPSDLGVQGKQVRIVIDDLHATYPLIVDPLLTTPAWTAEGNNEGYRLGVSVATAGDVNGDGYSDIIVGVLGYTNGEDDEGGAYVYLGSETGVAETPVWIGESNQANIQYGIAVASAGDVNGDGYDDVIVGAWGYDNGLDLEGAAFVYHGSATGPSASADWVASGNQVHAYFGRAVAGVGDVNGDGFDDVVVGAYLYDNGQADEGRALLYLGSAGGLSMTPDWTAESNQQNAHFGFAVAPAGDVNGDGYSDVIVGAPAYHNGQSGEGRSYLYHGSAAGLGATAAWTMEGNQAGAGFGGAVSTGGDVNGDGYADVVVGAPAYEHGQTNEGRVYL